MAKKSSHKIDKKITMKECWVKLKRLSASKIERHLKSNDITHNIGVKIKECTLQMGQTIITSKNLTFDVHIKLHGDQITITKNQSSAPSSNSMASRNLIQKRNQKSNLTVAVHQQKPIAKLIDQAWQKIKLESPKEFNVDDVVMAKLKGHTAWPAIIIEFVSEHKAKVDFFGANPNEKFGFVSLKEMVHFTECIDVIRLTLKKAFIHKEKFKKGIQEAELVVGIPSYASMLNE